MSAFSGRPSFSKGEIDLEKRRIALIDQLLAANGAMMINDLFRLVRTADASLFDKQLMLKSFIQSRTNIFQSDPALSTEICNRSMDYREAILCIVDELADTSRQRNVNFISSQLGLHYPTVKRCEIGLGVRADSKFVSEHKSILAFAGPTPVLANQRLVGLHLLSQTIPSVWVNETLPEYDPSTWRWDYSITISGTARVVHSIKDSSRLKLEIVGYSPYANDALYVVGADVGVKNVKLFDRFPLHSLVSFTAIKAYGTPQSWTVTSIKEAAKGASAELKERPDLNNNQVKMTATSGSSIWAAENMPTLTKKDEKYLVDLIDAIVGGERLLIPSLWTRLQEKYHINSLLKDEAILEQFLRWRPHLFFVNEGSVALRSYSHRRVLLHLTSRMKSGVKYTLKRLRAKIGSYDAEFKLNVYGRGSAWIQNFIDDHHTLLEVVRQPCPGKKTLGKTVQLRKASPVAGIVPSASCAPISPALPPPSVAVSNMTPSFIHGCGVIKKLDEILGYLTIKGGEHAGDTVYFATSELKHACGGSDEVGVGDHLNFDATNSPNDQIAPWRTTRLSLAVKKAEPSTESSNGACSLDLPKTIQNQQATGAKESTEIKLETTSKNPPITLVQRPSRAAVLQLELSRKAMTDNYLEYGPLSVDALFEKFALIQQDLFSYHHQMIEFLCIRSHLYAVDFSAKSVSRRQIDYRRALSKLLICCCQRAACSVEDLRQLTLQSNDNSFVPIIDWCASKLAFVNFLKEHEHLFEMTEVIDDKENRMVQARGTYDVIHDILLPRYYHVHS